MAHRPGHLEPRLLQLGLAQAEMFSGGWGWGCQALWSREKDS